MIEDPFNMDFFTKPKKKKNNKKKKKKKPEKKFDEDQIHHFSLK